MFGKKKCPNCGEKIGGDYNFCPYCRAPLAKEKEDEREWGMLGKNDFIPGMGDEIKLPFGFNMLFNTLLKSLNGQFNTDGPAGVQGKKGDKKSLVKKGGISISISTSGNKPPEIKVRSFGNAPQLKEQEPAEKDIPEEKGPKLPRINLNKFSGLPKEEPETNIRRLANKVIYEIKLPGVKSVKDVSIAQLENSIEIKALGKGKVFSKMIPINLPIKNYNLSKGKLTLELDAK